MKSNRYNALQNRVCVGLGFCGGSKTHVDQLIPDKGIVSADQFSRWLHTAEGFADGREDSQHTAQIIQAFVELMGADAVDASELKWESET